MRPAPVAHRQEQHLEIDRGPFERQSQVPAHEAGRFVQDHVDAVTRFLDRVRRPEALKPLPLEVASEKGAQARPGDPKRGLVESPPISRMNTSARMWRSAPGSIALRSGDAGSPRKASQ